MIHTIGDSHSKCTFEGIDSICIHCMGSRTMHRVGRDGVASLDFGKIHKHTLDNQHSIIISFGEIDVRCHIKNQLETGRNEDEIIETLANNYFATINNRTKTSANIVVMSVVPPAYEQFSSNKELPFVGSNEERANYTIKLNSKLKQYCKDYQLQYLDVYSLYANSDGMLPNEKSDGHVHIKDTLLVKDLLHSVKLL